MTLATAITLGFPDVLHQAQSVTVMTAWPFPGAEEKVPFRGGYMANS